MKKMLFWIRTGLLLIILIFAVLGGNFLYTGSESASPLDAIEVSIPLNETGAPVQNFSPAHPKVTGISLVLQAPALRVPDSSDIQSTASDAPIRMTAASGDLTIVLSDRDSGTQICSRTVSLSGVPDGWYLDIPVNCRLNTDTQYELSVSVKNYQEGMNPSIYLLPQSAQIPEATWEAEHSAAICLTYDVLVPARLAVFLAVLAAILLCTAATVFFSLKKTAVSVPMVAVAIVFTLEPPSSVASHRVRVRTMSESASCTASASISEAGSITSSASGSLPSRKGMFLSAIIFIWLSGIR